MTTARDMMTPGAECVGTGESIADAARKMASLNVGALPICGDDDKLKGMLTDRDIVTKVIAADQNPSDIHAGQLAEGRPVTIGVDDSAEDVVHTMMEHRIRRVPVIDNHRLVGIVSQADVARTLPGQTVADLLEALSSE